MYTLNDIKAAQAAVEAAKARPLDSFFTGEQSFFDDAPATREEAKAEFVAGKEKLLKAAIAGYNEQKAKEAYIAEHGIWATVI
jgi:hypothetical protein